MKVLRKKSESDASRVTIFWHCLMLFNAALVFFMIVFFSILFKEISLQNAELPENFFTNSVFKTGLSISQSEFSLARFLGYNSDFPKVNLQLSNNDLVEFEKVVISSINNGSDSYKDVKRRGVVTIDGERFGANVELKGDRSVHWQNRERRSYKLKLKGNATFNNLGEFSLQHAIMRNFLDEWVFHELLKHEDLLYLNYNFINFSVNGGDIETYVQEQAISNQVVEQSSRREGPIIRLDEESYLGGDFWRNTGFKVYDENYWMDKNPRLLNHAKATFAAFHANEISVSEALDLEKFGKYFAICDVLEAFHGCLPKSIRFYFNPITEKFEPIGFDGHAMRKNYPVLVSDLGAFALTEGFKQYRGWFQHLFSNEKSPNFSFQREYQKALIRLTSTDLIDSFFRSVQEELDRNLSFVQSTSIFGELSSQHPRTGVTPFYSFSKDKILSRAAFVRNKISTNNAVDVRIIGDKVEVRNRGTFALSIGDVSDAKLESVSSAFLAESDSLRLPLAKRSAKSVGIQHRLLGSFDVKQTHPGFVQLTGTASATGLVSEGDIDQTIPSTWVEVEDKILVNFDTTVSRPIRIAGKQLVVKPGVSIDFINEGFISTDTVVSFIGTDTDPIRLVSSDKTGRGLKVVGAEGLSLLQNVIATDLQWMPESDLRNLPFSTTPILFYESDVKIENCKFLNFQAEDVVNIFRSNYEIDSSIFEGGLSDALDTDFSVGSITNSIFANMGNDGIDISGSEAIVDNVLVQNVGDKAISVGEASKIEINNSKLLSNNIGLASKDGSVALISNSSILENNLGVVVFQKKTQYARASATIWRTNITSQNQNWIVETSADLFVNGRKILPNADAVRADLYD